MNFRTANIIIITLLVATLGFTLFLSVSVWNNFDSAINSSAKWDKTGQVGDFVGGVIGTIVSAIGSILIYLSLTAQTKAQEDQVGQFYSTFTAQEKANADQRIEYQKSEVESRFFDLLRLHKDNLSSITYDNPADTDNKELVDRRAIQFVVKQIEICYKEIAIFFEGSNHVLEEIYQPNHLLNCKRILLTRPDINLIRLAHLDICYSIVFFGTSEKDMPSLKKLLERYYKDDHTRLLLRYIGLKSVNETRKQAWKALQETRPNFKDINDLFLFFDRNGYQIALSIEDPKYHNFNLLFLNRSFDRFYGGHQFKLGQYFRHLFQAVKYINEQDILNYEKKYDYLKTLRAQLSTVEQTLLFYNSISFVGRAWELEAVEKYSENDVELKNMNQWLFTKYNFIKNIPALEPIKDLKIHHFYPEIHFEFEATPDKRKIITDFFRANN
jgi:hypothetical protein